MTGVGTINKVQQTLRSSDMALHSSVVPWRKRAVSSLRRKAKHANQDKAAGAPRSHRRGSIDQFLQEHLPHLEHLTPSFFKTLQLHQHPTLAVSAEASVTSQIQLGLHVASSLQQLSDLSAEGFKNAARALEARLHDVGLCPHRESAESHLDEQPV